MVEDTKLTPEDFNRACSLLPPEKCWGEHLTPEIVLHIADAATNAHLTALESERDALLAAAGKEAVAVAPFGWVKPAGGNYFTRSELSARRIGGMVPVYLAASTAALEKGDGRDAWISVDAEKPRAEWDKYYEDDFSEPVAVMIDYNGHHRRSEMTWRYSFAHGGWVIASLADGYMPSDYVEYGTVTHWAPLPAALSQKAGEK